MRKILLGTTAVVSAVVGAAVMAPQASAQEAPTVRLGGFFRAYYGYVNQTSQQSQVTTGQLNNGSSSGLPTNVGSGTQNVPPDGVNNARIGKNDISTDAGIDVIVNGKLANGLTYGAQISLNSSGLEGRQVLGGRSSAGKTTVQVDEMYAFIAHPRFGQVRFGDEDGVMGGLMNSGWVQGFGTGGVHGSWESFVTRQAGGRTTTAPGGLGDNSKIIYMTPQWAGFDFGASYAPNANIGEDVGCPNNANSGFCDSVQRQGFVGHDDWAEVGLHHSQKLGIQHQLLETCRQPAMHPARPVDHQMRPTHQTPPKRHHRFVGRLRVQRVGRGGVRRPEWHPDPPRQLPRRLRRLRVLWSAKGGCAGLHVDV